MGVPIYEYRCDACGKRSSALLRSYSAPDPECPHCGKKSLQRLVSTFATVRSQDGGDDDWDSGEDRAEHDLGEDHGHDHDFGGDDFGDADDDF